jgi:glycosyltransferase involved in cell wall biosynthesis
MKTRAPIVSVIIPTWNRCGYLGTTLESVLEQDHPAIEVIVDDGSTDATADELRRFAGRVTVIRQPNSGQPAAVNRGLAASRGDYLTMVSDDDPLLPGALSRLVDALETNLAALVAYPDFMIIDPEGNQTTRITGFDYSLLDMLRHHLCHPGPCSLLRRKALELVGGWDPRWRWVADYDFWLRIGLHGPMLRVPELLATWRRHPEAATRAAPRLAIAREHVSVIEAFFERTELPAEIRAVEREAMAAAWVVGSVVALDGLKSTVLPRFEVSDRLAQYVERPPSAALEPYAARLRATSGDGETEALLLRMESDRERLKRHVEVLERHLRLLGADPAEASAR